MSAVPETPAPNAAKENPAGAPSIYTTHPYRWVMLFTGWLMYVAFGINTASLAPLVPYITDDLGISHTAMGSVLGAWQLVYIGSAVLCGAVLDRLGIRRGLMIAGFIIMCSALLRGGAQNYIMLFLAVALFGLGGPLVSVGSPKLVSQWFSAKERPLAMGLAASGSATGSALALTLTHSVMMPLFDGNWRHVLFAYAGVAFIVMLLWTLVTLPAVVREHEHHTQSEKRPTQMQTLRMLLGLPTMRLVLLLSLGAFTFNHALNNWMPEILRHAGLTPSAAGYWAAVPAVVGIFAPMTLTYLATPERRFGILAMLLCIGAGATLLLQFDAGAVLYAGLFMQGFIRGTVTSVLMLVLMESREVGPKHAGSAGGLYFTAGEIGGVLGPIWMGSAYDFSGGFSLGLAGITVIFLCMLIIVGVLKRVETTPRAAGT